MEIYVKIKTSLGRNLKKCFNLVEKRDLEGLKDNLGGLNDGIVNFGLNLKFFRQLKIFKGFSVGQSH